jgi:hypothetical protein
MMPVGAVTHALGHEFRGAFFETAAPSAVLRSMVDGLVSGNRSVREEPGPPPRSSESGPGLARLLTEIACAEEDQALRVNVLAEDLGDLRRC